MALCVPSWVAAPSAAGVGTGTQQPHSSLARHPASDPAGPRDVLVHGRASGLPCSDSLVLPRRGDARGGAGLGETGTDVTCRGPCVLQTLSPQEAWRWGPP